VTTDPGAGRVHIQRLRLHNYRSVRECDIALQPGVTFLVGPNGAGKSNILDGLRFVSDSMTTSLDEAVQARGGFAELRHRWPATDGPAGVAIEITFSSPRVTGTYSIRLDSVGAAYEVTSERCRIRDTSGREHSFEVSGGAVESTDPALPPPEPGRLYLVTAANLAGFRPVYEAFRRMSFYNLHPEVIRDPQKRDASRRLARDGRNLASMLRLLAELAPAQKKTVEEYLAVVAPGVVGVETQDVLGSTLESLAFQQIVGSTVEALAFQDGTSDARAERFYAQSMSDGTLRALGVLVAIFQPGTDSWGVPLIGIEEPEAALHPRATAALRDALLEGGEHRQVLVTTHSPELLDDRDIDPDSLLAVEAVGGATVVGPPDQAGLSMIREGVFTAGELLRANQMYPAAAQE
jgi:predicted ATPase